MSDQTLTINYRSLKDLIVAEEADAPNVIRAVTPSVPRGQMMTGGTVSNAAKVHTYVRLEALPKELAERVRTALEAMAWG